MKTVLFIPARYASTRYPGKPLAPLTGPDGTKTLIQRSWEAAMAVRGIDEIHVATDDERIADCVRAFGGSAIMTDSACKNGTERCADALSRIDTVPDIVVNLQGDAPLTPSWFVEEIVAALAADPNVNAATPVLRCDRRTLAHFRADRAAGRVGGTTAVFDRAMRALYFSKEIVPYFDETALAVTDPVPVFHHVGLYAYRPDALALYAALPAGRLELLEGLEQIRFLEHGFSMKCVEVDAGGRPFWELNNPVDIERIEGVLA